MLLVDVAPGLLPTCAKSLMPGHLAGKKILPRIQDLCTGLFVRQLFPVTGESFLYDMYAVL